MLKRKVPIICIFVIVLGFLLVACKGSAIPEPKGFVNDFADMLPDSEEQTLEAKLVQYESQTGNEIAVVTIDSLGGRSIEEYTMAFAERWQVGKADKDNGIIILVAKEDKKIRIEVGYGLEPVLTDAQAKQVIDKEMAPRFSTGDYAGGITAAVNAVMGTIDGTYRSNPLDILMPEGSNEKSLWIIFIVGGIFLIFVSYFLVDVFLDLTGLHNRKRVGDSKGRYWSSGGGGYWSGGGSSGGGGSFGGFGGGGFGGGGASGGWR